MVYALHDLYRTIYEKHDLTGWNLCPLPFTCSKVRSDHAPLTSSRRLLMTVRTYEVTQSAGGSRDALLGSM